MQKLGLSTTPSRADGIDQNTYGPTWRGYMTAVEKMLAAKAEAEKVPAGTVRKMAVIHRVS